MSAVPIPQMRVRIQSSFAASDGSEPELDVAIVPRGDYRSAHPTQAIVIMEVADSSLATDRGVKARLYAESGRSKIALARFPDVEIAVADVL